MIKSLLLSLAILSLTACAKEEPKITKFVCTTQPIQPIENLKIIDKPIDFWAERIAMTKEYIKIHYGKNS